jgi:hypothetical protein
MSICCLLGSAGAQQNLRSIFSPAVIKELYPDAPSAIYCDSRAYENGHALLAEAFAAARPLWRELNAEATLPIKGDSFAIALIADQVADLWCCVCVCLCSSHVLCVCVCMSSFSPF